MGYLTYHTGYIKSGNVNERDVALAIARLPYFNDDPTIHDDEIESIDDVIAYDSIKWYNCIEDMKRVSTMFPDAVIKIHGEGEEDCDLWNAYFKNGKAAVYHAKIVYPEFNEEDLQ